MGDVMARDAGHMEEAASQSWYGPTTDEVACRECGYVIAAQDAAKLARCPRCGHGEV